MGKAYRIPSATDRLRKQQTQIKNLQAINRLRNTPRPVSTTSFAGISAAGDNGSTGNFLATKGDTMIGPLALGPPVDFRITIDNFDTIDIGESSSNSQYTSNIQLDSNQPNSTDLTIIKGAAFDGQILVIRTFAPPIGLKIKQGILANGGNIQTPEDADVPLGDLQIVVLIFDESLLIAGNTGGAWRLLNTFGAGGVTPEITTWKLPARAKSLANVSNLAATSVIFDGITLVQGDRVLLTDQTITSENGLYEVGIVTIGIAPLTRPTDFDTDAEVLSETFVAIEEGGQFKNQVYHLITNNPIIIDTTGQLWEQFAPGTSGGPDMGGGEDGVDAAGFFVNDGRIATGSNKLKNWEQIEDFVYPDNGPKHMLYLESTFSPFAQGRIVMIGDSNLTRGGSFSDNFGRTWTLSTGISGNDNMIKLAYDPLGKILVAVAADAPNTTRAVRRSTDRGTNYGTTAYGGGLAIKDIIWSVADSQFVLVEGTATTINRIFTSPDGNVWTQQTTPAAVVGGWNFIAYNDVLGLYVVLGILNNVMTSPDAINWTIAITNIDVKQPKRLIAAPGQRKFVAVGGVLPGPVGTSYISEDGINWTSHIISNAGSINDVIYAEDLSLYLVIGEIASNLTPQIFWFSNDAITWFSTPANRMRLGADSGTTFSKISVAYAQEYGYFFGLGGQSTTSSPFRANARFWRTNIDFNNDI